MKKCDCEHAHCCHEQTKEEKIKDPDSGREFIRTTCADPMCGAWICDKLC